MLRNVIGLIILCLTLSSCSTFGPQGVIYYGRDVALDTHNDVKPLKTGESCYNSFLFLVLEGNASIARSRDGNLRVLQVLVIILVTILYMRDIVLL